MADFPALVVAFYCQEHDKLCRTYAAWVAHKWFRHGGNLPDPITAIPPHVAEALAP